jgi:uncharacterized membrane protein
MTDQLLCIATFLAALGSSLVAGVFFAFAAFVLAALARLPVAHGVAAMQAITVAIRSAPFLLVFFTTAALAGVLGLAAPLRWSEPGAGYLLLGALLYFNGPFGVTLLKNLPLNTKLSGIKPGSADAARDWEEFRAAWGFWNHLRWIGALGAAASFIMALAEGAAPIPSQE